MNFFKKALIATAVVGSFGVAQAADVTNAVTATSTQGLEVGAVANSSVRVIVREQLEAGDKITLVFGNMFTISPTAVLFSDTSTTPITAPTPTTARVGIHYGSGTFTMGNATVTTTSGVTTVVFEVLTGDVVPKDASFEVSVFGTDVDKSKVSAATVTYSAVSGLTGNAKDTTGTNIGNFVVIADQYGASVKTLLNGVIERATQKTFVSGGIAGASTNINTDTLVIKLTDNQALLAKASGLLVQAKVTVMGDFTTATITQAAVTDSADDVVAGLALAADKKSLSFTVTDTVAADGVAGTLTITLDNADAVIKAQDYTVSIDVDASTGVTTNTKQTVLDKANAGVWKIDAAIINVPYFVVGKEGTSSSVHFSNLGPKADVIVQAVSVIDAAGASVTYKAVDLGFDLAANSVTKVSQGAIISALGIPAGTQKLSVTFNIDGKATDVSAYAFTQTPEGRSEISNSQQK